MAGAKKKRSRQRLDCTLTAVVSSGKVKLRCTFATCSGRLVRHQENGANNSRDCLIERDRSRFGVKIPAKIVNEQQQINPCCCCTHEAECARVKLGTSMRHQQQRHSRAAHFATAAAVQSLLFPLIPSAYLPLLLRFTFCHFFTFCCQTDNG